MTAPADPRHRIADLCAALAERSGDGRFQTAAAILRGNRAGRRPTDDAKPLIYAEGLLRAGLEASTHKACERAAELYAPPHQVETTRDRLRKKLRTKLINSEDSGY